MIKFEDYKNCLFGNRKVLRSQQRFKSENHAVYTERINKVTRIVSQDGITSYPYRYILKN